MLIFLFLATIVLSNLAVTYMDPVPVGFGLMAPAGVYFVAIALVLRDLVQRFSGASGVALAALGGMGLSLLLADPSVAQASGAAFAAAFAIDTLIFWAVMYGSKAPLWVGVLVSGCFSLLVDSYVFLTIAGLEQFMAGQIVGKTWGTLLGTAVVWMTARKFRAVQKDLECVEDADGLYCFTHHTGHGKDQSSTSVPKA